jgi:hypothetical protein
MEDVGIFYGHLVYFMTIWSSLRPFHLFNGHFVYVFCGNLVYISPFWYIAPSKIWQPCFEAVATTIASQLRTIFFEAQVFD